MDTLIAFGVMAVIVFFSYLIYLWDKRQKGKPVTPAPPPPEPETLAEGVRLVCTMDRAGEPQRRHEGPMIMQARYDSECVDCGGIIETGEMFAWRETEGARCMDCYEVNP